MNQMITHDASGRRSRWLMTWLWLCLLSLCATASWAQQTSNPADGVFFSVKRISGNKFQVYLRSNYTVTNLGAQQTGTGQVTLTTLPGSVSVTNIQNQNGFWSLSQVLRNPTLTSPTSVTSKPNQDYFIVGMAPTAPQIAYTAGVETPLFTFDLIGPCPGGLAIWEANDPFQPTDPMNFNVGNNIYALAFIDGDGNEREAWLGNYDQGQAACPIPLTATAPPSGPATQVVSGTTTPGLPVVITDASGTTLCNTTASASGTFACPVTVATTGAVPLTVTAGSSLSNTSTSVPVTLSVVSTPPPSLTAVVPPAGPSTQIVSGSATPGSVIAITDPSGATLCSTTVGASGTFACPVTVPTGVTPLTVVACNTAGCVSAPIAVTAIAPLTSSPTPTTLSTPMNTTAGLNASTVVNPSGGTGPLTYSVFDPVANNTPGATTPTQHGAVTINPVTGALVYTPTPGYVGPDAVTVRVCDSSTPTPQCITQLIPINVLPVSSNCVLPRTTIGKQP